jgi:hypothetical protein
VVFEISVSAMRSMGGTTPNCERRFLPQHWTLPLSLRAHKYSPPEASSTTPLTPGTGSPSDTWRPSKRKQRTWPACSAQMSRP